MTRPLITIGITCFREGAWLRECWESVLAQTETDWRAVLVADGGADDKTLAVCEQIQHPRLEKIFLSENRGPYPTRNIAFELTRTPYHLYLDGDDQLLPNSLTILLNCIRRTPTADIVYGDYELFGSENRIQQHPVGCRAIDLAIRQCISGPCLYSVQLWRDLGGFSNELACGNADYDFILGAYERGAQMVHCGNIFYRYRVGHSGKVSASYGLRYHETHRIIVRRHKQFFRKAQLRRTFLAQGYRRSCMASYAAGRTLRGMYLHGLMAANGLWRDRAVFNALLVSCLPRTWQAALHASFRLVQRRIWGNAGRRF